MTRNKTYRLDKAAEDQLIGLAAAGTAVAFHQLWTLYHGLLVRETHRHLRGDSAELEEARSLASLVFLQAIHDYDADRHIHFAAFLQQRLQLTLYNAFRQRRKDWQHTCRPDPDHQEQDFWERYGGQTRTGTTPEAVVCRRLLLRQLIQSLPTAEKQLLVLLYLQDLSQAEIAARLHISHQAVTRQKQDMLRRLRRSMSENSL